MADFMIVVFLLLIIGSAGVYMIRAKKSGVKCIGCPNGGQCSCGKESTGAGCDCGCHTDSNP